MDPCLEQFWRDIHARCVIYAADQLQGHLPADLRARVQERLPVIRIPLRPTDVDVPLDLQALIDQCYRNGGYDGDIDYGVEPDPPLAIEDASWADALLRQAGRR